MARRLKQGVDASKRRDIDADVRRIVEATILQVEQQGDAAIRHDRRTGSGHAGAGLPRTERRGRLSMMGRGSRACRAGCCSARSGGPG